MKENQRVNQTLDAIWNFAAPGAAALGPLAGAAGVSRESEGSGATNGKTLIPALLFVAGDYPDRGVSLTEADLDALIARFEADREKGGGVTPVKAEHLDTPLDPIGEVISLRREGPNLYGTLAFSEGVARHLAERGAHNLSVALRREPDGAGTRFSLREVSLVFKGRVPGAGLLNRIRAQEKLATFKAAGKVTPAMEEPLLRLLSVPSEVTFADGAALGVDVAAETAILLAALPALAPRGGQIPAFFAPSAAVPRTAAAAPYAAAPPELESICRRLGVATEKAMKRL